MKNRLPGLLLSVMIILVLAGVVVLLVSMLNRSLHATLDPIQQANQAMSTQVANLLHPTPTVIPDPVTIIDKVRSVARLETIHYTVEKVVTAEINQGVLGPLFGDRLLFIAHGLVIAGVDLSKLQQEDLWLDSSTLHVRLPETEILVTKLDNEQSYVYDRETGLFTQGDINLETLARQVAEDEIRKAALADGILDQAGVNARIFLERFFQSLGYEKVIFED